MPTKTLLEYTLQKISALPDISRLVVVFDPYAILNLAESIEDEKTRNWQVIPYYGNDLAFRKQRPVTGLQVIWVMLPEGQRSEYPPHMTINSLQDIWFRADLLVDASLPGVLREIIPAETWPVLPLWEQALILGQNLSAIQPALQDLRRYLVPHAPLDESVIRALGLHCLRPDLPAHDFLFQLDTPARVLQKYLSLLWSGQWNEAGWKLLQTQAQKAPKVPTESIQTWLTAAPAELARYIYLRRALKRFEIANPVNQLRGLGLLELDPEQLEAQVSRLMETWEQNPAWKQEIIQQTEASLSEDDLHRLAELDERADPESILAAIQQAETPAILSAWLVKFIRAGLQTGQFQKISPLWRRPALLADLPTTRYNELCSLLAGLLDEISFIDASRDISLPENLEITRLLDWYTDNRLYDLEYAQARASSAIMRVPESIREELRKYLGEQRKWLKAFLDAADHRLAQAISANWNGYVNHPRLSTQVLWETIKRRRFRATPTNRLWVVVFDGMRWDTWVRHIRPRLLENFEMVEVEKPYISLLPSWTQVARTGLLAGKIPGKWQIEPGRPTTNQAELAARLFEIKRSEMRFSSNMESDQKLGQLLDQGNSAYNVLVYNISDDNLHSIKGNLVDLNKSVDSLVESVIQNLVGLIGPNDTVILSSDHGFAELDSESAVTVADDARWQHQTDNLANPIRYRYIIGNQIPPELNRRPQDVLKVSYQGHRDEYIVPVGALWFKRAENSGPTDRYSHGGVSFAEMVVPGAILKRITERSIKPEFEFAPKSITVLEGETTSLSIRLVNKGNTQLTGKLTIQADLGGELVKSEVQLLAGERQDWLYPVIGIYRKLSGGREEMTKTVKVTLTYQNIEGQEIPQTKRINVTVQPRTDKVEIDFGGLPDLD